MNIPANSSNFLGVGNWIYEDQEFFHPSLTQVRQVEVIASRLSGNDTILDPFHITLYNYSQQNRTSETTDYYADTPGVTAGPVTHFFSVPSGWVLFNSVIISNPENYPTSVCVTVILWYQKIDPFWQSSYYLSLILLATGICAVSMFLIKGRFHDQSPVKTNE